MYYFRIHVANSCSNLSNFRITVLIPLISADFFDSNVCLDSYFIDLLILIKYL